MGFQMLGRGGRTASLVVLGVLVATVLAAAAATAAAATPEVLSPTDASSRYVRVAMDVNGNPSAIFFHGENTIIPDEPPAYCKLDEFGETDDCTVGSRTWIDGTMSAMQDLTPPFSGRMPYGEAAPDGSGQVFAVWAGTSQWGGVGGTVLRVRSEEGAWSSAEALSPDPFDPQVAVTDGGVAVVGWLHPVNVAPFDVRNRVQARVRAANGTLSTVQDISPAGKAAWAPDVAVNAEGDAVFVWRAQLTDGSGQWTVQARARSADGTLSDVQSLSGPTVDAWDPSVAIEADGDALIVWHVRFGDRVQARARAADGTLSDATNLSNGEPGSDPAVALTADGDALVVWGRGPSTLATRIKARARSSAGSWSAIETVSLPPQGGYAIGPQVAMDASGRAVVVWAQEHVGGFWEPTLMRVRSPSGAWSSVESLTDAHANTFNPQVDVNAAGNAIAAWEDYESDWGPAIHASRFSLDDFPPDLDPPETTITRGPSGATTRRTVSFRFRADEAGSSFKCRLDARAWRSCSSPKRYSGLSFGRHVFRVRATDPSSNVDPTPAKRVFRVVRG
jgi:hypothetical protein